MGLAILGDVLKDWSQYELDDSMYLSAGADPTLTCPVEVLPFDPMRKRIFDGKHYLLGIEQVRDVIIGLENQLHRSATIDERLKAVTHYARNDAFIDPKDL